MPTDLFNARDVLKVGKNEFVIYRLDALERAGLVQLAKLPFSIRIMLEGVLRQCNGREITPDDVKKIAAWQPHGERPSVPFLPARVLMHDTTGLPALVDFAAMRSAAARMELDVKKINPLVQADLIIDHSVQVDFFGTPDAIQRNTELEFKRNRERYEFLKWAQTAYANLRVVPPSTGILHQVNLEYIADVVRVQKVNGEMLAFPDTLVGTDSHTPMINALGVVGWGVGGIEAEAVMLGQPTDMLLPDVIGVKLYGRLAEGVTATDLVLTITQMLRKKGVVEKFVEFFGPGLDHMPVADRATIANMAPEYGATMGFFPTDRETLRYLHLTGRSAGLIERVEMVLRAQGLFRDEDTPAPEFTDALELDLGNVVPSLAGPKRPQDRVPLSEIKQSFQSALTAPIKQRGYELPAIDLSIEAPFDDTFTLKHGSVVLAAITACTNTSNPNLMIAAGLLAQKAVDKGLSVKPYVKTSLAPGSRVVTEYLRSANLLKPLEQLGFHVVGYGCTTCVGNSGPLPEKVAKIISESNLVVAAVLSGNRNFEARIHSLIRANYLASPPLVIAYALAGTMDIDFVSEPLGEGKDGPVFLRDIWPSSEEIQQAVRAHLNPGMFREKYASVFEGSELWKIISIPEGELFAWDEASTYIHEPPYFQDMFLEVPKAREIKGARVLAVFHDSVTTDHISPVGSIALDSPASTFLREHGIAPEDFNTYGARRGNDQVMVRGTFANVRLKNLMVAPKEGNWTKHQPSAKEMTVYEAAMKYEKENVPVIILAGKEYGTGSSRDWGAKGPMLQGVRAIIAESFERIHRSNLVGMGIIPMIFMDGQNVESLGLDGSEIFDMAGIADDMPPQPLITVNAIKPNGKVITFTVKALLNTTIEVNYYRNSGILQSVFRHLMSL